MKKFLLSVTLLLALTTVNAQTEEEERRTMVHIETFEAPHTVTTGKGSVTTIKTFQLVGDKVVYYGELPGSPEDYLTTVYDAKHSPIIGWLWDVAFGYAYQVLYCRWVFHCYEITPSGVHKHYIRVCD